MGICNRNNALYMATGIDNSGLYSGRREAIGIIKAMAGEITSFDVFGGIGISAGIAFAQAAKGAYDFEKQFQQSMKEVATLSSGIKGSLTDYMNQVVDLTRIVPVQANDAAKALYQIVSAGHDGADGMKILEVSAKAAIGGVTETATAADAITTVLNAYKMNASEAENISNQLFTTVRLGKTTFGELGRSIAQAAPIAAAYGVEIDQVLAAVATLTKQGTPTAQAMTQIRAAIVGVSKYLGDGAYNGRTFQEALELVRQKAGGSEAKLREFIPEIEAVNGLLGLTGQNAQEAAGHLSEMGNSTGAAEGAFEEMVSSAQNQLQLLQNNITSALRPMGEAVLKEVSDIATSFNEAFANGDVQESMRTLGDLIVIVTSALVGYKGSILAVSAAKQIYASITAILNKQRTIEIGKLVLSQGFYDADTAAVVKNTSARVLLTRALKAQFAASVKATGAMLANPYVLAAVAVAGLGYGLYKLATAESAAEKAVRTHREEQEKFQKAIDERKQKVDELLRIIQDETETEYAQIKAYEELKKQSPALTEAYTREELAVASLTDTTKLLNKERDDSNYQNVIDNVNRYSEIVKKARSEAEKLRNAAKNETDPEKAANLNNLAVGQDFAANNAEVQLQQWQENLDEINRLKKQAAEEAKPIEVRLLEAKSNRDQIVQEYAAAELVLRQEQEKIKNSPFATIPIDVQVRFNNAQIALKDIDNIVNNLRSQQNNTSNSENETYKQAYDKAKANWKAKIKALEDAKKGSKADYEKAKKELEESEKAYKDLGGITGSSLANRENEAEKLRKEQEKYKLLIDKQELERIRINEDLQMQVDEARINSMDEGSKKTIAQMELNFEKEMQVIDRQKEDILRKKIEDARSAWEANPGNKGKSFDASGIELSDDEQKSFDELYKVAITNNEKAYSDLVNQYLSYTDQRLEIEKKFNDDIAVLQEARKKAEDNDNTDEVAKIDRSIAKATADRGKELMKHDFDVLKQSPEYIRAFEDLRNTSSETLNSLLEQLENAKQTAAQTLNPEDLREYTTTIQEIMDELDARNPFQALADRQKELAEAEKELADAKQQLDAVKDGIKIVTGVRSTSLGEDGKIKVENIYLTATEALKKYNEAKDKHQQANNKFIKAEKTAREKVEELADAIKGIGDAIGGTAGEIISLMGDVALFATGTIDGISKVAQTGANAISAVEKASVILGIISTAIQLLQKIGEIGSNKAFKQYEAYAEKIKEINALTDAVNEYRIAALEARHAEDNWFSEDNLKNLRDYKKVHDEVAKAYADKAMESQAIYKNQSGGGWLTGAVNWVMGNLSPLALLGDKWKNIWGQGDYDKGQTAAIDNLRIETRKKSKGFLGTGIGGKSQKTEDLVSWARNQGLGELFDDEGLINKELAQSLIDNYGDKLVGQTKETLEALIKLREQYDEYIQQLHEYVNSLYEPLVDNFVDSLWDWLDNGKDALDSFKDYASDTFRDIVSDMMKTIALEKIFNNENVWGEGESYQSKISQTYEDYASGLIDEVELNRRVSELTQKMLTTAETQLPAIQGLGENILDTIKNTIGIDLRQLEDTTRKATAKGIATASQDSVDENNGRLAVMQEYTSSINEKAAFMSERLAYMAEYASYLTQLPNIDRNMGVMADCCNSIVSYLANIDNHTSHLAEMRNDMHSMKQDINTMLIKGLKFSKN